MPVRRQGLGVSSAEQCGRRFVVSGEGKGAVSVEELRSEDLEELVQELAEESGAPDAIPQRVRVCPKCGKHNPESAWHCSECSQTLSIETLTDKGAAKSPAAAKTLAPSELILLQGDKFARTSSAAVKLGEWVGLKVDEMMLATAFLAVEQSGAVQLEVRKQEALFGLLRVDKLYVVPGEHDVSWPAHSFESRLQPLARGLQSRGDKGSNHVSEIVSQWLGGEYSSPWEEVGNRVSDGLVSRGLLQKERESGLKGLLFGSSYLLPAETAALATQQSLEPIRELLVTCRRTRPEVWRLLIVGIDSGVGKCREPPDWD
jgi:hypothetical protein